MVTVPGSTGVGVAFAAEVAISFVLMFAILLCSNTPRVAPFTGLVAGLLVALYITLEGPLSGMSMNPARTFASAVLSGRWTGIWVYFTAPLLGMLAASDVYVRLRGAFRVRCAKLHHDDTYHCIFCEFQAAQRLQDHLRVRVDSGRTPGQSTAPANINIDPRIS